MTDFYAPLRASLTTLFASEPFVSISISRTVATYVPATRRTTNVTSAIPAKGLLSTVVVTGEDGTRSRALRIMMNVEPLIGDKITVGSNVLTVTSTSAYAPDGGAPLYFYAVVAG